MIIRAEWLANYRKLASEALPAIEVVEFEHNDFKSPASEQMIWTGCGVRANFSSGMLFWMKAMEASERLSPEPYFTTYAEAALCQPIDQAEFSRIVSEYSESLVPPLPKFLLNLEGWRSGSRMYADWNDVAIIAELSQHFIAFGWSTSA
jgi:hypothetical protein